MAKDTIDMTLNKKIEQIKKFKKDKDENDVFMGLKSITDKISKDSTIINNNNELIMEYMNLLDTLEEKELKIEVPRDKKIIDLVKVLNDLYEKQNKKNTNSRDTKSIQQEKKVEINKTVEESPKKPIVTKSKEIKTQIKVNTSTPKSNNHNDNIMKNMFENIIKQENNQISNKLISIETKVKTLGEDLDHKVKQITKDTNAVKDTLEDLESIPKQINKLNDSINNIEIGTVKKSRTDIPKDVQAIEKLTKYMRDGLEQFENIATYYVSNQKKLEDADKLQSDLDASIEEEKEKSFEDGKRTSQIDIAKEIYQKFPTDFDRIKSIFKDIMSEKYKENEEISINSENLNSLGVEIEGSLEDGKRYKIKTPAILIDNKILIRATVEMSK